MSSCSPRLRVAGISAAWADRPVLRGVSLDVGDREYFVLLGPNGSGKTTLLRVIAGLERPTAGRIELAGADVTRVPAHRRGIGMMFQDPALFPHRTVYENVAYAPLLQRRPRAELEDEVGRLLALLHLEGFEDRAAAALSGGERQRVALARTLAARPRLVLLDEPFASIDVELRASLRAEFRGVLRATGTAAIHVTHDREEGLFLGDRVGLLFDGTLGEVGPPELVYARPETERSARFLGYNIVPGPSGPEAVHPADLTISPDPPGLPVVVTARGWVGRERSTIVEGPDGTLLESRAADAAAPPPVGRPAFGRWTRSRPVASAGRTVADTDPSRSGSDFERANL